MMLEIISSSKKVADITFDRSHKYCYFNIKDEENPSVERNIMKY